MIAMVSLAEARVARGTSGVFVPRALPARLAAAVEIAPLLRGACAIADPDHAGAYKRFVLAFRNAPAVLAYVNGAELQRYSQSGVATPDHTIRTKNYPLVLPPPDCDAIDGFKAALAKNVADFAAAYRLYFARQNARLAGIKRALDAMPRVVLVP